MGTVHTYFVADRDLLDGKPCLADRILERVKSNSLKHNLVLCSTSGSGHPLAKELKNRDSLTLLKSQRGREADRVVAGLLASALAREGITMAPEARRELISRVGRDPQRISREVGKLAAYAGDRDITRGDVISLVSDDAAEDFGLQNAIRSRRAGDLARHIDHLVNHGTAPQAILAQAAAEFRRMTILSSVIPDSKRALPRSRFISELHPALKEQSGVIGKIDASLKRNWHNPYYMYYLYQATQNYPPETLRGIMVRLGEIHVATRRGLSDRDMLASLIHTVRRPDGPLG